jgi:hypothetical protein
LVTHRCLDRAHVVSPTFLCFLHHLPIMELRSDVLERRKSLLDREIRKIGSELRALSKRRRVANSRAQRAWSLSALLTHAVLIIYILSGYAVEPAVVFLQQSGRSRHWPELPRDELVALVERVFLDVDLTEIADLTCEDAPSDGAAMRLATTYLREWRVVSWGTRLNLDRGTAPTVRMLVDQAHQQGAAPSRSPNAPRIGGRVCRQARKWASRLRSRWGARMGTVKLEDVLSADDVRSKVSHKLSFVVAIRRASCSV